MMRFSAAMSASVTRLMSPLVVTFAEPSFWTSRLPASRAMSVAKFSILKSCKSCLRLTLPTTESEFPSRAPSVLLPHTPHQHAAPHPTRDRSSTPDSIASPLRPSHPRPTPGPRATNTRSQHHHHDETKPSSLHSPCSATHSVWASQRLHPIHPSLLQFHGMATRLIPCRDDRDRSRSAPSDRRA